MSDDEREEKELDLTSPEVVTKYKSAAEIVNSECPPSLSVYAHICACKLLLFIFSGKKVAFTNEVASVQRWRLISFLLYWHLPLAVVII